ncbi:MAG: hypothetical protein KC561_18010 [Myxococcales bacterium]|nr:hypothetical protein [Myxococcales bacterium]
MSPYNALLTPAGPGNIGPLQVPTGYDGYLIEEAGTVSGFFWAMGYSLAGLTTIVVDAAVYASPATTLLPSQDFKLIHTRKLSAAEILKLRVPAANGLLLATYQGVQNRVVGCGFDEANGFTVVASPDYLSSAHFPMASHTITSIPRQNLVLHGTGWTDSVAAAALTGEPQFWKVTPNKCSDYTAAHKSEILYVSQNGHRVSLYRTVESRFPLQQATSYTFTTVNPPTAGVYHRQNLMKL